jgi:glycerol-3-phosphate dehydrogenase (NAD(P)+)
MKIGILGAGAWGTGLAITLAPNHAVTLWARSEAQRVTLRAQRRSDYLAEVALPASVAIGDALADVVSAADLVLIATPTAALRAVLREIAGAGRRVPVVWACKGFEQASGLLPHQIVGEVFGPNAQCAALSGPSFALEVARGLPTALTVGTSDEAFAESIARELHHARFRVYFTADIVGVEVGGSVKNVMAIATGIADGLGLGMNARAALITRGLAEVTRLGVALGGRVETFMGLAGAGDLILTCTGDLSRNRRVGLELARGDRLDVVLGRLGHVAEGVYTAQAVERVARSLGVEMPITEAVCGVLFGRLSPARAVEQLLSRDPKAEQ